MINFNINGNTFLSNGNVTIINGQIINGAETAVSKKFDEVKFKSANDIDKIAIESSIADVTVSVSNSPKIEAHFYGNAATDGNIDFKVRVVDRELKISLIFMGNCYASDLKLDVVVPRKTFHKIAAKTLSAKVVLDKGVAAKYIKLKTQSGRVNAGASFTNISVRTMSGKVKLLVNAETNISIDVSSMSGNITAKLNNIGDVNLSARSMSGSVDDYHQGKIGYMANVNVSTMSGNVTIL